RGRVPARRRAGRGQAAVGQLCAGPVAVRGDRAGGLAGPGRGQAALADALVDGRYGARMKLQIAIDPLEGPQVAALLQAHVAEMRRLSPRDSVHALGLSRRRAAEIPVGSAYRGDALLGCAAVRALDAAHGEVKSMRTTPQARRRG